MMKSLVGRVWMPLVGACLCVCGSLSSQTAMAEPFTIAFGSCLKEKNPAPILETIAASRPDVFVWVGDNIYGDTDDMDVLRGKYAMLAAKPGFAGMARTVLATWDDHDYGRNDAGADFAMKRESQQVFCDFWGESADSPRRTRDGIYDVSWFDAENCRVQVILLDTRSNRSSLPAGPMKTNDPFGYPGSYGVHAADDASVTILGETQWAWLEERLREPADLRIVATSIQFVSEGHRFENWANFPRERLRMIELINRTGANGVVFISGDRHTAELSRLDPGGALMTAPTKSNPTPARAAADAQPRYPFYDFTSSALNQTRRVPQELNAHRLGSLFGESNFGLIVVEPAEEKAKSIVRFELRDAAGKPLLQHDVALGDLAASAVGGLDAAH